VKPKDEQHKVDTPESDAFAATIFQIQTRLNHGLYIPEQVPRPALEACRNPQILAIEKILARAHCSIPPDQSPEYTSKPRTADRRAGRIQVNNLVRPLEEEVLRSWTLQECPLLDNAAFQKALEAAGSLGGSEHDVYPDSVTSVWLKRNNLTHHGNYLEFFHRLILHNWLFPDTELDFKGFVQHNNLLLPIVAQEDIPAARGATPEETDGFMHRLGFAPIRLVDAARSDDYIHVQEGVEVNDLHDENVLIREDGSLAVMDPIPMMEETSKLKRLTNLPRG
jgi:hypothetical protein